MNSGLVIPEAASVDDESPPTVVFLITVVESPPQPAVAIPRKKAISSDFVKTEIPARTSRILAQSTSRQPAPARPEVPSSGAPPCPSQPPSAAVAGAAGPAIQKDLDRHAVCLRLPMPIPSNGWGQVQ